MHEPERTANGLTVNWKYVVGAKERTFLGRLRCRQRQSFPFPVLSGLAVLIQWVKDVAAEGGRAQRDP